MRQGQQNRRGRGRNHNHQQRKSQNPLSRSYESSGPDVKLRGTPNHIAEKYMSLARDAQSSGDPVLAENYLQHAEHYNRIIMAFREQNFAQGGGDPNVGGGNGGFGEHGSSEEGGLGALDAEASEEGFGEGSPSRGGGIAEDRSGEGGSSQYDSSSARMQPDQGRAPYHHQGQRDRNFSEGRGGYHDRRDRRDRHEGRDRGDRRDRPEHRYDRRDRDRGDRSDRYPTQSFAGETRGEGFQRRDRNGEDRLPQDAREQPEFLRRSVRRTKPEGEAETDGVAKAAAGKERGNRE